MSFADDESLPCHLSPDVATPDEDGATPRRLLDRDDEAVAPPAQGADVVVTLASVRAQCASLANDASIDKETALRVVRLHHDMETLLLRTSYDKDRAIRDLQAELNVKRLGDAHAEVLRRRDEEILQLRQVLSQQQQQQQGKGGKR